MYGDYEFALRIGRYDDVVAPASFEQRERDAKSMSDWIREEACRLRAEARRAEAADVREIRLPVSVRWAGRVD